MKCPGKVDVGCMKCQNFFFNECLGGDQLRFIPRMTGTDLQIFAVQLQMRVTKEAIVNVFARSSEDARFAVEADLENNFGVMADEVVDGEEHDYDGDVDVNVYETRSQKPENMSPLMIRFIQYPISKR